jgi:PAS domain S-box-containing protein
MVERELPAANDGCYLKRVYPYRTGLGQVDGAVLTYSDVAALKAAERVLLRSNEELEALVGQRTRELVQAREETERRAAELEAVMEQTPAAIWITRDPEALTIVGNPASYRILRMVQGDNVSASAPDAPPPWRSSQAGRPLPPESLPLKRAAQGATVIGEEIDLAFPDGEVRTILGNATPLRNSQGTVTGAVGVFLDITERKTTENKALRWQRLFECARFGLSLVRTSDNTFLDVNPTFASERGYTPGELAGKSVLTIYPEEVRPTFLKNLQTIDSVGHGIFEASNIRKDGSVFPVLVAITVLRDKQGRPVSRVAYYLDIAPRKLLEQERARYLAELERQKAFLESLIRHAPILIGVVEGPEHRYILANPVYETAPADNSRPMVGRTVAEVFPEVADRVVPLFDTIYRTGESVRLTDFPVPLGSRQAWFDAEYIPMRDATGGITQILILAFEVTQRHLADEALRRSELTLRTVADYTFDWEYWRDDSGKMVWMSPSCERVTGYAPGAFLADSGLETRIVHPEDRAGFEAHLCQIGAGDSSPTDLDFRIIRRDGQVAWINHHCVNIAAQGGGSLGRRVSNRDITDRKHFETALAEREEQLRLFVEHAPAAIAMFDTGMHYMAASRRWADDYKAPPDSLLGRGHYDVFPDTPERWREIHRRCLAGAVERAETELFPRADGSLQWVSWEVRPWYDAAGTVGGIVIFSVDVTERERAKEMLYESEERFRTLANSIPQLCWMANAEGWIFWYNRRWYDYTGTTPEQMEGWGWQSVHDPETLPQVMERWKDSIATARPFDMEFPLRGADGVFRPFLTRVMPVCDQEGHVVRWCGTNTDVTERKRMEEAIIRAKNEAERANLAKSEFLANMSHEIRTPLNGVLGMLQLLRTTAIDEEQKEYLLAALKSSNRLTRLLSDILDLSRIEAGRLVVREAEFSVAGLKESLTELFAMAAREKGLALAFSIDERMPPTLIGDENRLVQILFNLVGNGIKFTEKGAVKVAMTPLPQAAPSRLRVLFSVSDSGIGISDDLHKNIFEPFVQAEGSFTRRFQGAGLGLSIVTKLVRILRGELCIDSVAKAGTTIYLSLPFRTPLAPREPAAPAQPAPRPAPGTTRRVLFVEDDEVNRLAGKLLLEKSGYAVVTAADGREALERLAEREFDLILMDVQMPVMDGVEATRAIRSSPTFAGQANIPIIAMTSYAMAGDRDKFMAAGMDDYIAKPVDLENLKAAIARVLTRGGVR